MSANLLTNLEPRRIALIKPSALGDIMHTLPVLSALRQRFPSAHIAWVVNRLYEPLLREHPDLDATLPFDRHPRARGVFGRALSHVRFLRELGRQRFDLAIDLQCLLRTGLMSRATGAPVRLGLASAREGAGMFYTHRIDDGTVAHAVDRYWRVIEELGVGDLPRRFHLPIDVEASRWAKELLAGKPRPWLAVGVGARWLTKRWPARHFAQLAGKVIDQFGGTVVLIGAPDEAELARQAESLLPAGTINVTGKTTLLQLAAVLSQVDAMLANDTGPLHLAVALGRPVVAPYTCTKVARTGPYAQSQRAVESGIWCQGSYLKNCARLECMQELEPQRLWPQLHEILLSWQRLSA